VCKYDNSDKNGAEIFHLFRGNTIMVIEIEFYGTKTKTKLFWRKRKQNGVSRRGNKKISVVEYKIFSFRVWST
jgi:hypothetical protein